MGSEIFNLKSLYMEDTVVRGARVSTKNAKTTRTIEINPGDEPVVKTGETGINKEYLIQSSFIGNDLNGYGTFINNSDVIRNYTGAQNLSNGDKIKLDSDRSSYTVTGIQGTDVYILEKYSKEEILGPDVLTGPCSIWKIKLDSAKYEAADAGISYNKDANEWGVTGVQMSNPIVAPSDKFHLDTGIDAQFQSGTSSNKPDIATILSSYKTLVSNNTSPIYDVSLSPIPFPHSSLQVFMGKTGEDLKRAIESEDYIVNYTNGSEVIYPIPPYEERDVAYLKFLGRIADEIQVESLDATFSGNLAINRMTEEGGMMVNKPVQGILPTDDLSIKISGLEKTINEEYLLNYDAGIVTFVEHSNSEALIDTITYPKKLIWDGISVIRGVKEEDVENFDNLVIPGISGIKGVDYKIYFEDTDTNNLIRDVDFIIDPESGAFSLTTPTRDNEAYLISYYVEGEDIKDEKLENSNPRLNSYPLIADSLVLTKKYNVLTDTGSQISNTRVLVEGIDYRASSITGFIDIFSSDEVTVEIKATYTPLAQINCVVRSIPESLNYTYTIVGDVLSFSQDTTGSKRLIFKVNNPSVSIPKKILFDSDKVDSNYNFIGSINPENILEIKSINNTLSLVVKNAKYDDIKREIELDSSLNPNTPQDGDTLVGTYSFESDVLPYAPLVLIFTVINAGESFFTIEGYDKTDSLKSGMVLRVDNKDPQSSHYFIIESVTYSKQSTRVDIYGTFPETIIDPAFYVFDSQINWESLSNDVQIDTGSPISSEQIIFNGGPLFIKSNLKKDALLLLNSYDIYTVTSITTQGEETVVGIYPPLRSMPTSNVKFSRLPVYEVGITTLPAKKLILNDTDEPAFTLWYNAPEGFEGSAKILFIGNKIVLEEYISGIRNPVPYEYDITLYSDVYTLAKEIQATKSTFKDNVPDITVPDYNPFTIAHSGKENFYLGTGNRKPDTLKPFEEETSVNLPYTFKIVPDLYKYSLLSVYSGKNEILVPNADVTSVFSSGMVIALINKVSGRYFFSKISGTEYMSGKDTTIRLSSSISENMIDPFMYTYSDIEWVDLTNTLIEIDRNNSRLRFSGNLLANIRKETLLQIHYSRICQVNEIIPGDGYFDVLLNSVLDSDISLETYSGYIKYSTVPVILSGINPQPFVQFEYTAPKTHTGVGYVKIDMNSITFKEVVDNFRSKESTLIFNDFDTLGELFDAVLKIESDIAGKFPFKAVIDRSYRTVENDPRNNFNYTLSVTDNQFVELPNYTTISVAAFKVNYEVPSGGYSGNFGVWVKSDRIIIKESLFDMSSNEYNKETTIYYKDTANLFDLINNVIPAIPSVISSTIFPFSTNVLNSVTFGNGSWETTHLSSLIDEYITGQQNIFATINVGNFLSVGPLNVRRLKVDSDYTIDNGVIELNTPIEALDRFLVSYMGLDSLYEDENDTITCSCRFLSYLPPGYNLNVYLEYINIDQFYIQKLTERRFTEIVTIPQIDQLVEQKGSAGGQGNDSGASSNTVENYEGGIANIDYLLQDEYIKKQLYVRFYQWYKQRLRGLSAELQLGLGFKFGHSTAVGETNGYYSLEDAFVETEDYTLTSDTDLDQIENGYSKFFPVNYDGQAPDYYHRFGNESLSFNEVYCCNISYRNEKNVVVKVGVIKSNRPYWNRTSDLIFKVWDEKYINKNLVGSYNVDVPEADRTFSPINYTFLKVVDSGDKVKIDSFKKYYTIDSIVSPNNKDYEYILVKTPFIEKGVKTYNIVDNASVPFDKLMDNLPPDGYRIWINRPDKEEFPMCDDFGSLGATAYGESIEGLLKDGRRIRKPSLANLLKLFFPNVAEALEPSKNFKILVKKDSEGDWETLGTIDLSKLTFKEERNVDDVLDALRYDFTEKFTVPIIPPYTVYDIKETDDKGFYRYFYLSLERVYDAGSGPGYYYSIVLRAKDRNWWIKVVNGGEEAIIDDYGFSEEKTYKNFYDPDNIYKKLLLEKQAWQTEELIVRDLYDYNDKIARAFDQGDLNRQNSRYQQYLAMSDGGSVSGISDILRTRITAYEKQLHFLVDTLGPVYRTLYPDLVHAEDNASPDITLTYNQTQYAWDLYNTFYNKMWFYNNLNEDNNNTWKNNYIRWVMSLERGVVYQKSAKAMYEINSNNLTIGIQDTPTIRVVLSNQTRYTVKNPKLSILSNYDGKYLRIVFDLTDLTNINLSVQEVVCLVYLYTKQSLNSVPAIVYKSIDEVCSDISAYTYEGISLFIGTDVFEHYENNVVSKLGYVNDLSIDPINGAVLNSTNVADHRASDSRVLFLNKNVEDRVYTHEIRELPGFDLSYNGDYYFLKYGIPGLTIDVSYYYDKENFKYGVFFDETGERVLNLAYDESGKSVYTIFKLYTENNGVYTYKTLLQLSEEINSTFVFQSSVPFSNRTLLCNTLITTSDYVSAELYSVTPYITVNSAYSSLSNNINQFYYKVYTGEDSVKKMDCTFYNVILDGKNVLRDTSISDTFTFSLQKSDNSYKTISELCKEISTFKYRGENIFSAISTYKPVPNGNLSTAYVIADNSLTPIGYDWDAVIYVDTYLEAISGKDANSRTIANIKNAVFSFPMYTANGNPNKIAIEDIPVSGKWESEAAKDILEIECLDGLEWSVSFSDYDSGDYKSYMAPQEILTIIDSGNPITEEQYNQLKIIEDQPLVAVLKELVLKRTEGGTVSEARFNLRQYGTLNDLINAIINSRFNDSGELDPTGDRTFYSASLIGDPAIEGIYKSNELYTTYIPIIKSFSVLMDDGTTIYKNNQLIGWNLTETTLSARLKHVLKLSDKRYSHGTTYGFKMSNPEKAYIDTLLNNPQGFRRDILAFDIFSWDYNAHYEVRDNWIYFRSDSVNYSYLNDVGQPDKGLGYGIPLAGSGHYLAPDKESLSDLLYRINNNTIVNKFFYANLKFTRDDKNNPGYFEYDYLPNFNLDVPRSTLDNIMLKDDAVMKIGQGSRYIFTNSNITINDDLDTLDLSCDWQFDYNYEKTLFFNKASNLTVDGLANSINIALAPEIGTSLVEAVSFYNVSSTSLIPTYIERPLTTSESYASINIGLTSVNALSLKIRNSTGSNYTINSATFVIPKTKDRLILKCKITYHSTYNLVGYGISSYTVNTLVNYLSLIRPYSDSIFTSLFSVSSLSSGYGEYSTNRLLSTSQSMGIGFVSLTARLHDITALRVLNMTSDATLNISGSTLELITTKNYTTPLPTNSDIQSFITSIKGDYSNGFISSDVLPLKISSVTVGYLNSNSYSLTSTNIPAHVYFGVMGDIKFVQISDNSLHIQYNYIKERLGMPWRNTKGQLDYDYYTPENYNENNPCAIDLNNFLGYLRTGRYNQIKNSIINESVISNKYLWLYMKFHKEFGCDQRAKMLKDAIQKGNIDINTLNQAL